MCVCVSILRQDYYQIWLKLIYPSALFEILKIIFKILQSI